MGAYENRVDLRQAGYELSLRDAQLTLTRGLAIDEQLGEEGRWKLRGKGWSSPEPAAASDGALRWRSRAPRESSSPTFSRKRPKASPRRSAHSASRLPAAAAT